MLYCGIDWSWEQLTLFIIDDKGNPIKDFVISNDLDGFMYALFNIRQLCKEHDIIFAIETSNQRVIDFLISYDYKVYLINSNSMDKFRNRYKTSGVKSDSFDAFVIANVLRTDISTLNEVAADDQLTQELGMVLRDRESLIELKTRLSNQLRDSLRQYFPQALDLFKDISCIVSLQFLEAFPTHCDAKKATKKQIQSVLRENGYYSEKKLLEITRALGKKQFPPRANSIRARKEFTLSLVSMIKPLVRQIKAYDEKIESLLEKHPDTKLFLSLPGVGNNLAGGMISALGADRSRFDSPKQIQSLGGTAPITKSSGNYTYTQFRFRCNKTLRKTLHQFAFSSITKSLWAKNYYNKKRSEGKTSSHAFRCLANAWVKVIFAVWKNKTVYDENRHLASVSRHMMSQNYVLPLT